MMKRILGIPGSLRTGSANHQLLAYIGSLLPINAQYRIFEGLGSIQPFDPGLDTDVPPLPVGKLREEIAEADAVVICTPEYAFGIPGQLKNALDWLVGSGTLDGKPVALITASLSGEHAHAAMQLVLSALNANIIYSTLIQFVRTKVDSTGNITDQETLDNLNGLVDAIQTLS